MSIRLTVPLTFLWLLLLTSAHAQGQTSKKGELSLAGNRLCWLPNRRLTWSDFQSPQCYENTMGYPASFVGASTCARVPVTGFLDAQGRADYRVTCYFVRDSSWVNPRLMDPGQRIRTLAHEQLHFDIAELIARKIRRCIAQHQLAGHDLFGPLAAQDIQCLLDDYVPLSNLYDDDVQFRRPAVEAANQRRWTLQVARELRGLARYQSTATTCSD